MENTCEIAKIPKYVGCYRIGSSKFNSTNFNFTWKPYWFHRLFTKILLGWTWIDYKN